MLVSRRLMENLIENLIESLMENLMEKHPQCHYRRSRSVLPQTMRYERPVGFGPPHVVIRLKLQD